MPKGALRILNAAKVQAAFRQKGRVTSEDTGEHSLKRKREKASKDKGKGKAEAEAPETTEKKIRTEAERDAARAAKETAATAEKPQKKPTIPKIGPNETLGEYNRRVEALMRGSVNKAIKAAESLKGQQIQALKEEKAARRAKALGLPVPAKRAPSPSPEPDSEPERTFAEAPQRRRLNDVALAPPQLPKMRQAKKHSSEIGSKIPLNAGQKRIMEEERERVIQMYRDMKARKEADKVKDKEDKEQAKRAKKRARKST